MRHRSILHSIPRAAPVILLLCGVFLLTSASAPPFTPNQKAYYASDPTVNFVRPGLVIKVLGAETAADGTVRARVRFTDLRGLPLDREGVVTPGPISCSFILAYIPKDATQYVAYTTRRQTSPINGVSAVQAGSDAGGTWARASEGEYIYTFGAKLPAGADRTATHTVGAYGSRSLVEFDLGTNYSDSVFNFVPDGSAVRTVRDVIRTATCNKCHLDQGLHGGSRKSMELCVLCHTPQTIDPDTGNTVDMPVMTHKIHMGSRLPSVVAGGKYQIIGFNQTVADYSKIAFTADARSCFTCHEQGTATQAANVYKGNRAACGACHDDVNFATGLNHNNLPQVSDNQCTTCHTPKGELEFDASIEGAHTIPRFSKLLPGVVLQILEVTDTAPGQRPTVVFSVKDKAGNPIPATQMTRLRLYIAGPNSDYTSYVTEDAQRADGAGDGRYWWTFANAIPRDAKGSWTIAIEGRRDITLYEGTRQQVVARDTAVNRQFYFSVEGGVVEPRRKVVAIEKCNACHAALAFHGEARNSIEECVMCHAPTRTDNARPAHSIDLGIMVHKIHRGHELERGYAIGNASFNDVGFPGDLRNCAHCHVNGSEALPLPEARIPITDPSAIISPAGRSTAICLSCHDGRDAAAHAATNTSASIGEACGTCHGSDAEKSVARVHAR